MTITEIKAAIEAIERKKFYLSMKDHWSGDDFLLNTDYQRELNTLRHKLAELEAAA